MNFYFDTNVYRKIGRMANKNGLVWLDSELRKLKYIENKYKLKINVSYLVLAEMVSHLNDDISSNTYIESKYGLYAALFHSNFSKENMLSNADNEFINCIAGDVPISEKLRENSMYEFLLTLNANVFSDRVIRQNSSTIQLAKDFLNTTKSNWKDSFVNHIIKKHDSGYTGNWQLLETDKEKRTILLKEFREIKNNNQIYNEFGIGMYEYIKNNSKNNFIPELTDKLLLQIIIRFKPLFDLQYRIIELMFQSGRNLDKHINDIIDFLIISNLDMTKSIFVSNETRNLVPNMDILGYSEQVWTLDKYGKMFGIELFKSE